MNIAMVAANTFKWCAWGSCRVTRIHGWNNQAANVFIQLFELPPVSLAAAPQNTQVPTVKSFLAQPNNGFDYEFGGGISLKELTVCCSTTETSLTIVGANGGLDMTIELDTVMDVRTTPNVPSNDNIAGDVSTGVNTLQVWTNSAGPKRLLRIDQGCSHGTTTYMQLHTIDSPPNGTVPLYQFPANTDTSGNVQALHLGDGGLVPLSGPSTATQENTNKGCTLAISTTSGSLTAISDSSGIIRAIYGDVSRA